MEIKTGSLQAKIIADALQSQQNVLVDCAFHDEDWRSSTEKEYGMPLEFVVYAIEGLIKDLNGAGQDRITSGLIEFVRNELIAEVKALASLAPAPVERVQVSEVASRTTTIERPTRQKTISAGNTDKAQLLEILRSGRKLTPEQRRILGMKKCSRCGEIKEFSQFGKSNYQDGHMAWCLRCDMQADESEIEAEEEENLKCECGAEFADELSMRVHRRGVHGQAS